MLYKPKSLKGNVNAQWWFEDIQYEISWPQISSSTLVTFANFISSNVQRFEPLDIILTFSGQIVKNCHHLRWRAGHSGLDRWCKRLSYQIIIGSSATDAGWTARCMEMHVAIWTTIWCKFASWTCLKSHLLLESQSGNETWWELLVTLRVTGLLQYLIRPIQSLTAANSSLFLFITVPFPAVYLRGYRELIKWLIEHATAHQLSKIIQSPIFSYFSQLSALCRKRLL